MADITVSLTDEEKAALETAVSSNRLKFMAKMLGVRGELGDISTPETFTTTLLKGLAREQIRIDAILKVRDSFKIPEIK